MQLAPDRARVSCAAWPRRSSGCSARADAAAALAAGARAVRPIARSGAKRGGASCGCGRRVASSGARIADFERAFDRRSGTARATPRPGRFLAEAIACWRSGAKRGARRPRKLDAAEARARARDRARARRRREPAVARAAAHRARRPDGRDRRARKLLEADPKNAQGYLSRMARARAGRVPRRRRDRFRRAARRRMSPHDARAHERLGDLYRARQERRARDRQLRARGGARRHGVRGDAAARGAVPVARRCATPTRVLRRVLRGCPDDELVKRAGRSLLQLHLGGERLRGLEQSLRALALAQHAAADLPRAAGRAVRRHDAAR